MRLRIVLSMFLMIIAFGVSSNGVLAVTPKTGLIATSPILILSDKNVQVTPRGLNQVYNGQVGIRLDTGDVITVGKKAYGCILFPSNTIVFINPYTKVEISKFEAGLTEGVFLHEGAITVKNRDPSLINQFTITTHNSSIENTKSNHLLAHFVHREDKSLLCINYADSLLLKSKLTINHKPAILNKDSFIEVNSSGKVNLAHPINNSLMQLKEQIIKQTDFIPVGEELAYVLKQIKKIAIPRKLNN